MSADQIRAGQSNKRNNNESKPAALDAKDLHQPIAL